MLSVGEGLGGHTLGDADHRRQWTLHHLVALVGDAFRHHAVGFGAEVQLADLADVRQAQQFGQFRPHLARLRIGAVPAADNEVRLLSQQYHAQGAGGGQGIRTGQGPVAQQDAAVGAQGHAGYQPLPSLGRPHGDGHHFVIGTGLQLHRPDQAQNVERVNLGRHAVADDGLLLIVEGDSRDDGYVFDTDGRLHSNAPWARGPILGELRWGYCPGESRSSRICPCTWPVRRARAWLRVTGKWGGP